jgi:hypothetical protein
MLRIQNTHGEDHNVSGHSDGKDRKIFMYYFRV